MVSGLGSPMDYEATLQELYRLERFGIKLGLANVRRLLSLLGDPHRGLRAVHVTGTNGKGSVATYPASALRAAGYRVGLYTSPHLVRFNERIRVDGEQIPDEDVLRLWQGMQPAVQAMSGSGRMDATNVIDGAVAVITRIGLEHTEHLGKTIRRIAREKAGIIKPGARAVSVDQEALPVIEARCTEVGAHLTVVGRDVASKSISKDLHGQHIEVGGSFGTILLETSLLADFQVENVGLAVAALTELRAKGIEMPDRAIVEGVRAARWPGRLQVVRERPWVVVDGAHNSPAIQALAASIRGLFPGRRIKAARAWIAG